MAQISYKQMMQALRIQEYRNFIDYDRVIDLGIKKTWENLCAKITTPGIDPTDVFDEEREKLKNLQYRMNLMSICALSEMWEQDLYNFLKEKGLILVASNDYKDTKKIFEEAYASCAISKYPEILEMRALVNAIKHGEGNSLSNIRSLTRDAILADSNISIMNNNGEVVKKKQIEFDCSTLTSRTLNVSGKLQTYIDALVRFWQDVFAIENETPDASELE